MTEFEKEMWRCNIQNAARDVVNIYGTEVVLHILRKYGARSIESLSSVYYTEVFDELDFMVIDAGD